MCIRDSSILVLLQDLRQCCRDLSSTSKTGACNENGTIEQNGIHTAFEIEAKPCAPSELLDLRDIAKIILIRFCEVVKGKRIHPRCSWGTRIKDAVGHT